MSASDHVAAALLDGSTARGRPHPGEAGDSPPLLERNDAGPERVSLPFVVLDRQHVSVRQQIHRGNP